MSKISAWKDLVARSFRTEYIFPITAAKNWFPGHMHKGLKDMQRRITDVDCVIEVHDARIPLSGRNTSFKDTISGVRPHILVLNKEDLVPREGRSEVAAKLKEIDPVISKVIFSNGKYGGCRGMKAILPTAINLIESSNRYHRAGAPDKTIIIIGIPNVGKSTIINQLRHRHMHLGGKAAAVGAAPGVTRMIQEKVRICDKPLTYLLDTPGISKPNVKNMHVGMKLAVCNTLRGSVVGEEYICDYLLWYLNQHHHFDYVEYMGLKQPEDNSKIMLAKCALAHNKTKIQKHAPGNPHLPDFEFATMKFLRGFRDGQFGRINLDEDAIIFEMERRSRQEIH